MIIKMRRNLIVSRRCKILEEDDINEIYTNIMSFVQITERF